MTRYALLLSDGRYKIEQYNTEKSPPDIIAGELKAVIAGDFPTRDEADLLQHELEERMKPDSN
jgi:hypothetical protein